MTEETQATEGVVTFTEPVVMAFPNVLEAKKFKRNGKEQGEAKFSASFPLTPDCHDLAVVKARIMAVAKAKWPGRDISKDVKEGNFKLPYASGNSLIAKREAKLKAQGKEYKGDADFMKDTIVLKASSKYQPTLAFIENGSISPNLEGASLSAHKGKFYFGCEVVPQINLVPYDGVDGGRDGVTAYLNQVLSFNKGKRLSGARDAAQTFAAFAGKATAEDPTDGLDDEIPF